MVGNARRIAQWMEDAEPCGPFLAWVARDVCDGSWVHRIGFVAAAGGDRDWLCRAVVGGCVCGDVFE